MGMAYGFSFDENPTPLIKVPGLAPPPSQQTPAEYSDNVLSGQSNPLKNCITILPYDTGKNVPMPTTQCVPSAD